MWGWGVGVRGWGGGRVERVNHSLEDPGWWYFNGLFLNLREMFTPVKGEIYLNGTGGWGSE